ncbi:unnamed protein product [Penicillium glandicola]
MLSHRGFVGSRQFRYTGRCILRSSEPPDVFPSTLSRNTFYPSIIFLALMLVIGQASQTAPGISLLLSGVIAVALYNSAETVILIFASFKRYRGVYFWSLLTATIGVFVTTLGYATYFFNIIPNRYGQSIPTIIGWCTFIIAQSLVLWSRLHFLIHNPKILRGVLVMIIMTAVFLLIPTAVLAWCNDIHPPNKAITKGYQIMEDIQLTGFSLQETIISGLYIWGTISLLAIASDIRKRNLVYQLFTINVVLISMDCILLGLQYSGHRTLQIGIKCLVYSLKLKLELAVLSRLTNFVRESDPVRSIVPETESASTYRPTPWPSAEAVPQHPKYHQ